MKTRINNIGNYILTFHWGAVFILLPLIMFPTPQTSWVLLLFPISWILNWVYKESPFPITPLNLSILLLILMVLISLWATYDIGVSLPKISGIIFGIWLYFFCVQNVHNFRQFSFVVFLFLGIGLIIALIGFFVMDWSRFSFSFFDHQLLQKFKTQLTEQSIVVHPNELAGSLLWVYPLLLVYTCASFFGNQLLKKEFGLGKTVILRMVLTLQSVFLGSILLLSGSRGAILGLVVSLVIIMVLGALTFIPKKYLKIFTFGIIISFTYIGYYLSNSTFIERDFLIRIYSFILTFLRNGRLEIWAQGIMGVADFPITGMGLNTFRHIYSEFYPLTIFKPGIDIGHTHNEFLQVILDLGFPGGIAFGGINITAVWLLLDAYGLEKQKLLIGTSTPTGYKVSFSNFFNIVTIWGLGGCLLAHQVYGVFDAISLGAKPGGIFWILLSLIVILHSIVSDHSSVKPHSLMKI
jgi:putative inorganic carbon (hco3(-)) transporter